MTSALATALAGSTLGGALLGAPREVLAHSLPWYFGFAVFLVWAGAAVGFTLLFRRRMRARAERRNREVVRPRQPRHTPPTGPIRDDRSLGSGSDLERW